MIYAGASLLMPPVLSAGYSIPVKMLAEPFQTIAAVQRDIFPGSSTVPSPKFLGAAAYLGGVFEDPYVSDDTKQFIRNGAGWLNERADEMFGKAYYLLPETKRQAVLQDIAQRTWGDNWLWTLFSFLFEALLGDPVYGVNTDRAGWSWLGHEPGYPRPKAPFYENV